MRCMYCGHDESKVIDSRSADDGNAIRRRRECLKCGNRFTTYEKIERLPVMIVKKDKSRELFDREKIQRGVLSSCASRPVPVALIDKMIDEIETEIYNTLDREISSQTIGEMVMKKLREIDEISYVRFASVYKEFKDIDSFKEELIKLQKSE